MKNDVMISRLLTNRKKFLFFAASLILLFLIGISTSKKEKSYGTGNYYGSNEFDYHIISPPLPSEMNFAGEKVPLDNFEVTERIDRELLVNVYWHSSTIMAIKRINRWFPVIEPILRKNKIPDDFKYIPVIESNLLNTVSPAGAVGFWQITDEIAKKYGLEINSEVDERYNIEKSTQAACYYFQDAYNKFNSWTLAAAAYNMGINGLTKQIERQKVHNYYNILLSDETSRYIARILAMKEILNHQHKYGYYISSNELYNPLKTHDIQIDSSVKDWADFALEKGITYKILKYFNPWLRDIALANKNNKNYIIKLPDKGTIEPVKEN